MKRIWLLLFVFYASACFSQAVGGGCSPVSYRGQWNGAQSYTDCVMVIDKGSTYISVVANFNSEPSPSNPKWQAIGAPMPAGITVTPNVGGTVTLTVNGTVVASTVTANGTGTPTLKLGNAICTVAWQTPTKGTISCIPSIVSSELSDHGIGDINPTESQWTGKFRPVDLQADAK